VIERLLAAEAALDRDELDIAERLFDQVSRADERNAIAVVGLGRVAARRGRHDDARALMERALAIDPDEAAAQRLLAELDAVAAPRIVQPGPAVLQGVEAGRSAPVEPQPTAQGVAPVEPEPTVDAEPTVEPAHTVQPEPAPASRRSLLDRILRWLRRKPDGS
jgi:tetratricopeptide (TPR) repeat protein